MGRGQGDGGRSGSHLRTAGRTRSPLVGLTPSSMPECDVRMECDFSCLFVCFWFVFLFHIRACQLFFCVRARTSYLMFTQRSIRSVKPVEHTAIASIQSTTVGNKS